MEPPAQNPDPPAEQAQEPALVPNNVSPSQPQNFMNRVLNYPLSTHEFDIPYDEDIDMDQYSRATHFLLNTSQDILWTRLKSFFGRSDFFDTSHLDCTRKGCWVVKDGKKAITITHKSETHEYSAARVAARLWLDQTSLLRLISDRGYQVRAVCHNSRCINPRHIVVESSKEFHERKPCKQAGSCMRHTFKLKTDDRYRRRCIFPRRA